MPYVSIVIPTFNEHSNIGTLIQMVKDALKAYDYEIIVVDRHSPDGTADDAEKLGAKVFYDDIGKGSALIRGFGEANGKIIISMDADLSNNASELGQLITGIESGYDICMGSRFIAGGGTEDMPRLRRMGNAMFVNLVNLIFRAHYTDLCYGYRSLSRQAMLRMGLRSKGFGIETEMSIKARKLGLKVLEVPSFEKKRAGGHAKLSTFIDGFKILMTIIRNI